MATTVTSSVGCGSQGPEVCIPDPASRPSPQRPPGWRPPWLPDSPPVIPGILAGSFARADQLTAEAVEIACVDHSGQGTVAGDRDPRRAGVEALDIPLGAVVTHELAEPAGVVAVFPPFVRK